VNEPLTLHYIDDCLIAAEKPSGLLSVPGRGEENQDCVVARLQALYPDALTVHRLDMVTSGLLLHARGKPMQAALSQLFERRQVSKRYLALVEGQLQEDSGSIELPLRCDWENRPRQMVDHELGKPALTRWQVLRRERADGRTLVELEPVTGRSHQLRVHMASLGHPIVGDSFYGAQPAPRVCLHACQLGFVHPVSGQPINLHSPAPFAKD
jgi:tRNA pseudouridine32 synthase/23S rRNA pseudouridine746 synthase